MAQTAAVSSIGWRIRRERYGGTFPSLLSDYVSRDRASEDEMLAVRRLKLRRLLTHARAEIPYWSRTLRAFDVDPERVEGPDDLANLPILTKADVLRLGSELRWSSAPRSELRTVHTSGTTGAGLILETTIDSQRDQWAVWWRFRRRHGLDLDTWHAMFMGWTIVQGSRIDPKPWRTNWPGRQVFFSQYHLGPATAASCAGALERMALPWFHGYPSVVSYLAALVLDLGGPRPRPRVVSLGAENVLPSQARAIHEAFGVEPISHYGLTEMVANASQCPNGRLHIDEDFAAVELVPAGDGTVRIVGTSLFNRAMPLIRYDTGDLAVVCPSKCGCGLPGRVLERIDGRQEDFIELKDGTRVGRADHLFKDAVRVAEAQIRQQRPGACEIVVVPRDGFGPSDEAAILRECESRFGNRLHVAVRCVESIERTSRGKLRLVVKEP
jgi:phenylacetate-CoA ligase